MVMEDISVIQPILVVERLMTKETRNCYQGCDEDVKYRLCTSRLHMSLLAGTTGNWPPG